jgi:hypothetical protein
MPFVPGALIAAFNELRDRYTDFFKLCEKEDY